MYENLNLIQKPIEVKEHIHILDSMDWVASLSHLFPLFMADEQNRNRSSVYAWIVDAKTHFKLSISELGLKSFGVTLTMTSLEKPDQQHTIFVSDFIDLYIIESRLNGQRVACFANKDNRFILSVSPDYGFQLQNTSAPPNIR